MKTAILPSFHRIAPAAPRPAAAPPSLSETTAAEILRHRIELKEHREDLARFTREQLLEHAAALGCPRDPLGRFLAWHYRPLQCRTATGELRLLWLELLLARAYPAEISTAIILRNPWTR